MKVIYLSYYKQRPSLTHPKKDSARREVIFPRKDGSSRQYHFLVVLFLGFFATTFSRHGRIDAGIILLFWLNENIGLFSETDFHRLPGRYSLYLQRKKIVPDTLQKRVSGTIIDDWSGYQLPAAICEL